MSSWRRKLNESLVQGMRQKVLLLVGEGNFSFALDLASRRPRNIEKLVASSIQTEADVLSMYPAARSTLGKLRQIPWVCLEFGVDATNYEHLLRVIDSQDVLVVWNFPSAAEVTYGRHRENHQLMHDFLDAIANCSLNQCVLRNMELWITLFGPQWGAWQLEKVCTQRGFTGVGSLSFDPLEFPIYSRTFRAKCIPKAKQCCATYILQALN